MPKPASYTKHALFSIQERKEMHVEINQITPVFQYTLYFFLKIVHLIALRADIFLFMN